MFIKRTTKKVNGKSYTNHLLVESVATPAGPRHRVICSLGALAPAPAEQWLALAHDLDEALSGQQSLLTGQAKAQELALQLERPSGKAPSARPLETIDPAHIEVEQAREAGAVHVGHHVWQRLEVGRILRDNGLSERACLLTQIMTLNRLIAPRSHRPTP